MIYRLCIAVVASAFLCPAASLAQESGVASPSTGILRQSFEDFAQGTPIGQAESWNAFAGFRGESVPQAMVTAAAAHDGKQALAVWHTDTFRTDNWGLRRKLEQPVAAGVVWLQCHFRPPGEWTGNVYLDARAGRGVVARIGGAKYEAEQEGDQKSEAVLRVHASWHHSYWRRYRTVPLEPDHWYRLSMRIDLDGGTYSAWIDDYVLGIGLPLCSSEPIDHIYLGLGGTEAAPAYVDDLLLTRRPLADRKLPRLYPEAGEGLVYRMAVVGDPQVGFGDYQADLVRYRQAVEQIKASGAELTLVLGDMVHDNDQEQAYRDVKEISQQLGHRVYFVRGNHDRLDLYQKHFHPEADFAFSHKGVRFVFVDAIGNHAGLTDDQLAWIDDEFRSGARQGEELVLCLHVSPWEDNAKGRGKYNQIGPGRDRLVEMLTQYRVLLSLSGHYHRGLWHGELGPTHCLVLGGTALVKQGHTGWCVMDVYPDRIVIHQKPIFGAYEQAGATEFYDMPYSRWTSYAEMKEQYPYLQQGPLTLKRLRPAKEKSK